MEGLAILGGTRPESCRRTREACIDLGSQRKSQFVLCCAVRLGVGCCSLPALAANISQQMTSRTFHRCCPSSTRALETI